MKKQGRTSSAKVLQDAHLCFPGLVWLCKVLLHKGALRGQDSLGLKAGIRAGLSVDEEDFYGSYD